MRHRRNIALSIVVPVYNEEDVLPEMLRRLSLVLKKLPVSTQTIFVDDGSTDKTLEILLNQKNISNLQIFKSNQNHGHQTAILYGLRLSSGNYVVTLDADLQDPPELIPEMYKKIKVRKNHYGKKYDVIQTSRSERKTDKLFKRLSSSAYYVLLQKMSKVNIIPHAADFRLMTRKVVNTIISENQPNAILRILIPRLDFSILEYKFERQERYSGQSKYSLTKMFSLAVDSILSTNARPLRMISLFGLVLSFVCLTLSILSIITWLVSRNIPGWTSIIFFILSLNGFLILFLGFIGEYIAKIYDSHIPVNHQMYTRIVKK
jgi:dolichol-phosphate mannosyltransferase